MLRHVFHASLADIERVGGSGARQALQTLRDDGIITEEQCAWYIERIRASATVVSDGVRLEITRTGGTPPGSE